MKILKKKNIREYVNHLYIAILVLSGIDTERYRVVHRLDIRYWLVSNSRVGLGSYTTPQTAELIMAGLGGKDFQKSIHSYLNNTYMERKDF